MDDRDQLQALLSLLQCPPSGNAEFAVKHREELEKLRKLSIKFRDVGEFSSHPQSGLLSQILATLSSSRLGRPDWLQGQDHDRILPYLQLTRVLLRDRTFKKVFTEAGGVKSLCEVMDMLINSYMQGQEGASTPAAIVEAGSGFMKLVNEAGAHRTLINCDFPKIIVRLLSADVAGLLSVALKCICSFLRAKTNVAPFLWGDAVMDLLNIIDRCSDTELKRLAAQTLLYMSENEAGRELLLENDALFILVPEMECKDAKTLHCIIFIINKLARNHKPVFDEFRMVDGVALVVDCLRVLNGGESQYMTATDDEEEGESALDGKTPANSESSLSEVGPLTSRAQGHTNEAIAFQLHFSEEEVVDSQRFVCSLCGTLAQDDANSRSLIEHGAVYQLAQLILVAEDCPPALLQKYQERQLMTLVALRLLYSIDFRRKIFMRLFGNSLFEWFVDVGNFKKEHRHYKPIVENLKRLQMSERAALREQMAKEEEADQHRHIAHYKVLDELGAGSFGTVLRVQDTKSNEFFALKELRFRRDVGKFGSSEEESRKVVKEYIAEVGVVSAELFHKNVVRYYKAFQKGDHLYVVMKLIAGTTLGKAMQMMKEKGERFGDERVTKIVMQLIAALYYIHKTKRMVHRDIKPANIMLDTNDHVTLTDFGLAQCKPSDSSLLSTAVGTLMYQSPEVMKSEPYSDKTDIWAIGCIIYQMVRLEPAFSHQNNFLLMQKIVAAEYEPIPEGTCSDTIRTLVEKCLQPSESERVDVVQLGSLMTDSFLLYHNEKIAHVEKVERRLKQEKDNYAMAAQAKAEQAVLLKWCKSDNRQLRAVHEWQEKKIQALEAALASLPPHLQPQVMISPTDCVSPSSTLSPCSTPRQPPLHSRTPSVGSMDSVFTSPTKPVPEPGAAGGLYGLSPTYELPRGSFIHRLQPVTSTRARSPSAGSLASSGMLGGNSPMLDRTVSRPKSSGLGNSADVVYIPRGRPVPSVEGEIERLQLFHKMTRIRELQPVGGLDVPRRIVNRFHQALLQPVPTVSLRDELNKLAHLSTDVVDIKSLTKRKSKRKLKPAYAQSTQDKSRQSMSDSSLKTAGITYADLKGMIDRLLPDSSSTLQLPDAPQQLAPAEQLKHLPHTSHGGSSCKLPPAGSSLPVSRRTKRAE